MTILRMKGRLHTDMGWFMFQGVRDMYDLTPIPDPGTPQHLIFIGSHLDSQRLQNATKMHLR